VRPEHRRTPADCGRTRAALLVPLLVLGLAAAGGCDAFAWILTKTIGPWVPEDESVAEYSFTGKSVLVLVDTEGAALSAAHPRLATVLAERVIKTLADRHAAGPLVPAHGVDAARRAEPDFEGWTIVQAGKYFNVDLVLHIQATEFRLKDSPESTVFNGSGEAVVQVVSTESAERVWPVLASARIVRVVSMPGTEPEEATEMEQIMTDGLADKIARYFFTYKKSELPMRPKVR